MSLHPSTAARVVRGMRAGRVVLTPAEAAALYVELACHPDTEVDGELVRHCRVYILDVVEQPELDYLIGVDDEAEYTHLASYAEGLIDADDVNRLLA